MKENFVEEKGDDLKETNNIEGKDESKENEKDILINPMLLIGDGNEYKTFNYYLYYIP